MDESDKELSASTVAKEGLGFDYQFYYFVYLALQLEQGEKIGYEFKEDVYWEKNNKPNILIQSKHSVKKNKHGFIKNLTNFDPLLWETLIRWIGYINKYEDFLINYSFQLVTNKQGNKNLFIKLHENFLIHQDISYFKESLREMLNHAKSNKSRDYINTILKLDENKLSQFLQQLSIQTGVDDIENKIKNYILNKWPTKDCDTNKIYSRIFQNFNSTKYAQIKNHNDCLMTFDEIKKIKIKSLEDVYGNISLPVRDFNDELPEDIENQLFIRQLEEIGELGYGPKKIERMRKYTTFMLKAINSIEWWLTDSYVLESDIDEFKRECVFVWEEIFDDKYRKISKAIHVDNKNIIELEEEICQQAILIVSEIRRLNLKMKGFINALDKDINNGFFYFLSNQAEIGWHYDWENKYKIKD